MPSEAFDLWLKGLCRKPHPLAGKPTVKVVGVLPQLMGLGEKNGCAGINMYSSFLREMGHESWGTGRVWCGIPPPSASVEDTPFSPSLPPASL